MSMEEQLETQIGEWRTAVLRNRAALVDDIYSTPPPAHVIRSGV